MDHPNASLGHLPIIVYLILAVAFISVCGLFGQKAWSHQTLLTKNFEACMEAAPFKHPLGDAKAEAAVTPELLPTYFEEFDQIFETRGFHPFGMATHWCHGRCSIKNLFWLQSSATNNLGSCDLRMS